jgi:hypothetical protein
MTCCIPSTMPRRARRNTSINARGSVAACIRCGAQVRTEPRPVTRAGPDGADRRQRRRPCRGRLGDTPPWSDRQGRTSGPGRQHGAVWPARSSAPAVSAAGAAHPGGGRSGIAHEQWLSARARQTGGRSGQQEPETGPVVPRNARNGVSVVINVGPLSARFCGRSDHHLPDASVFRSRRENTIQTQKDSATLFPTLRENAFSNTREAPGTDGAGGFVVGCR